MEKMRLLHDLAGRRSGKWMPTNASKNPPALGNSTSFSTSFTADPATSGFGYSNNNNNNNNSNNNNSSNYSIMSTNTNISQLTPGTANPNPNPSDPSSFYTQNNTNGSLDNALLNAGGLFSPNPKSSSSVSFISPLGAMAALNATGTAGNQQAFTPNNEAWGGGSTLTEAARRHANMVARINQVRN